MIKVAVGIVYNSKQDILIAQRPSDKHLGGFWEFPGGKIEEGETTFDALKREFKEEVNLELLTACPLTEIIFQYPDKQVCLDVWKVDTYKGQAQGLENQKILWVPRAELEHYNFPEANQNIFRYL